MASLADREAQRGRYPAHGSRPERQLDDSDHGAGQRAGQPAEIGKIGSETARLPMVAGWRKLCKPPRWDSHSGVAGSPVGFVDRPRVR